MSSFKKWLYGFTSLFFAIGLWIAITLTQFHQRVISIPFELKNIPQNLALSKPIPKNIYLTIRAEGWDLFFFELTQGIAYRVDVSTLTKQFSFNSLKNIYHYVKIPENFQIISIKPDIISLNFEEKISKIVPIKPNINLEYKTGFSNIGKITLQPESVKLIGAPSILNRINFWETEYHSIKNINKDVSFDLNLSDSLNFSITSTIPFTKVSLKVEAVAEKSFSNIPLTFENLPTGLQIRTVPSNINVSIKGTSQLINKITQNDVIAIVNFEQIFNDTTGFITPRINLPNEIYLLSVTPHKIQYFKRKIR